MVIGMLATPWFLFQVAIPVAQGVLESVPTLVTQGSRSKSFSLQFVDRLLSGEQCKEIVLLRDWEIIEKLSYFSFSRFAGSVVRAANDTSPLLLEGIAEFTGSHHTITVHTIPGHHVNQSKLQPQVWYWRHYSLFSCTWSFFGCFQVMICFVAKRVLFF